MALTSPFANLYESIVARIKDKAPLIRYIDHDLGQLENYGDRPPVSWPCALIDLDEFEYEDQGNELRQHADGFVIVRLGTPAYSSTAGFSPNIIREKGLAYYENEQEIIKALHGWNPTNFGRLMRRKVRTEKRDDAYRVRILVFAIQFTDETAVKAKTTISKPGVKIGVRD